MIFVLLIFITDVITSYKIISKIKISKDKDVKDLTEKYTEEVKKHLRNKSIFNRRLLNAFPHLQFINNKKTPK